MLSALLAHTKYPCIDDKNDGGINTDNSNTNTVNEVNKRRQLLYDCICANQITQQQLTNNHTLDQIALPIDNIQQQQQQQQLKIEEEDENEKQLEHLLLEWSDSNNQIYMSEWKKEFSTQSVSRFYNMCYQYYFASVKSNDRGTSLANNPYHLHFESMMSLFERTDRNGLLVIHKDEPFFHSSVHHQLLLEIGYFQTKIPGIWHLLLVELLEQLENAKNQARRAYHLYTQQERILHFERIFNTIQEGEQQQQQLPTLDQVANLRHHELKQFVGKYGSDISSHSFLKGLRFLLSSQLAESKHVFAWSLPESLFTQSLGEEYTADLIKLLFRLGFKTDTVVKYEYMMQNQTDAAIMIDNHRKACLVFTVDPNLSNGEIRQLLYIIPQDKSLQTRGSNDISLVTTSTRSEMAANNNGGGRFSLAEFLMNLWLSITQIFRER